MSDLQPLTNSIAMPLAPDIGIEGLARSLGKQGARGDLKAAEKAAKDFESVLLYKLMEEMRRTVPESELLESGASRQIEGIFWYYLAQEVADGGGLGLWKDVYKDMVGTSPQNAGDSPSVEQYR